MNSTPKTAIKIDQIDYQLKSIDEFGFFARVDLPTGVRGKGLLTLGDDKLEVGFRVRENLGGSARCSFSNLSPSEVELIQNFLRKRHRGLLEGAPTAGDNSDLIEGDKSLTGLTPKPESQSNTSDSLPSTDASTNQAGNLIPPSKEAAIEFNSPGDQQPPSVREIPAKPETAANQWETTKSIQPSPARIKNSARYIPPAGPQYSQSRTVAPRAVPQATDAQMTAGQNPTGAPVTPSAPEFKVSTPDTKPPQTIKPETIKPDTLKPESFTPKVSASKLTDSTVPAIETVVTQTSVTPQASITEVVSTPEPSFQSSVAVENAASSFVDASQASASPTPMVTASTSTTPLPTPRPETTQPAPDPATLSARRSKAAAVRAARRADSARPNRQSMAIPIILALTGLSLIAYYFLRDPGPQGSFGLAPRGVSAATSNFLPVTVKADGEVVELLVAEGDIVKKGDVLMRLENSSMKAGKNKLAAELTTAKAKIKALKQQLKSNEKKIKIATAKLAFDLEVAKSDEDAAAKNVDLAKINLNRMKPALDSGAITTLEFDEVRQELVAAKASKMAAENKVKQIEFAQSSLKENILISGGQFDDDNGRLTSNLEIAAAEQKEMEAALVVANEQLANLNVKAPRDGTVSAVYRQVGELVKVADETIGLTFDSNSSRSLTDGKPVQITPEVNPHQNDLNVKGVEADKVATDM